MTSESAINILNLAFSIQMKIYEAIRSWICGPLPFDAAR